MDKLGVEGRLTAVLEHLVQTEGTSMRETWAMFNTFLKRQGRK